MSFKEVATQQLNTDLTESYWIYFGCVDPHQDNCTRVESNSGNLSATSPRTYLRIVPL